MNWLELQTAYDGGLSQRDLSEQFGIPPSVIQKGVREGKLISRTRSDACRISAKLHPTPHSVEANQRRRDKINQRYSEGWMPKAGRCKKYKYNSPIAGEVLLDGSWELAVAKWLDSQGLTWARNTKRFPYTDPNGKSRTYTPDFWIESWNSFLEVKGYETELDRCKWRDFTNKLIIWRAEHIVALKESGPDGKAADC